MYDILQHQSLFPNYSVLSEARYFPLPKLVLVHYNAESRASSFEFRLFAQAVWCMHTLFWTNKNRLSFEVLVMFLIDCMPNAELILLSVLSCFEIAFYECNRVKQCPTSSIYTKLHSKVVSARKQSELGEWECQNEKCWNVLEMVA